MLCARTLGLSNTREELDFFDPRYYLSCLGFRLNDSAALVAVQERLERAGIRSQREEGVECCYAKQTKFWVTDPDRTLWEIYTFEGDIDHRGVGQALATMVPDAEQRPDQPVKVRHALRSRRARRSPAPQP